MAFAQQSGPPASHGQVKLLLELLQAAGHADFRDARGPLGFTQRQAAGKFTRAEAETLIAQLQEAEDTAGAPAAAAAPKASRANPPTAPRVSAEERLLQGISSARLAAELQRRGWIVVEP